MGDRAARQSQVDFQTLLISGQIILYSHMVPLAAAFYYLFLCILPFSFFFWGHLSDVLVECSFILVSAVVDYIGDSKQHFNVHNRMELFPSFFHFSKMKYLILYLLTLLHMDWLLSFHPKCPFENQFPFLRSLLDLTINSLALYNYFFFFFCVEYTEKIPSDIRVIF